MECIVGKPETKRLSVGEQLHCTQLAGTGLRDFRLIIQSELPLPADHDNFVHQQNEYGR